MKRPHKMRLLDEIAQDLQKEGIEVNHAAILKVCMGHVAAGRYEAGSLGKITSSDISRYFREFYAKA